MTSDRSLICRTAPAPRSTKSTAKQSRATYGIIVSGLAALVLLVTSQSGHAQQKLPNIVRLVVPYAAGGPADLVARLIAERTSAQGVQLVIESQGGGGGTIGAAAVARGPTDGSSFLLAGAGLLTVSPHLDKTLRYDVERDFTPVLGVAQVESVFVVSPTLQAKNLKEFLDYARTTKPTPAIASGGAGTVTHLYIELLKDATGIDFLHVPYKGSSPALVDVMSGQVAGTMTALGITSSNIKSGQLKAIAMLGAARSKVAPEIPTFAEQGVAGLDMLSWWAIMGPKDLPPALSLEFAKIVRQALLDETAVARLRDAGITPWTLTAPELVTAIRTESERWGKLIRDRKLAP